MEKLNRADFLKVHSEEIVELVEFVRIYKELNYNRLMIWKELRDGGVDGLLLLEAFRRTGLFLG